MLFLEQTGHDSSNQKVIVVTDTKKEETQISCFPLLQ